MAKRRKVALVYQYNENWIGGTYYIENLVKALMRLPKCNRPFLYALTEKEEDYAKLQHIAGDTGIVKGSFFKKHNILKQVINRISNKLSQKNLFGYHRSGINVLFPADINNHNIPGVENLYWIPDFQEHYLPDFFSKEEIANRKQYQQEIANKGKYIVFSSEVAKKHFNEIYPKSDIKQFVLPFAVSHSGIEAVDEVIVKYKLPANFYICSNQFWRHKNHKIILNALALLKQKGIDVHVAFTGKEYDFRYPDYFDEIKNLVAESGIEANVSFLGFIERNDQLTLMQKAIAVIQPSLFEGWGTVIEDAKSLGATVLASDIEVHREQLEFYGAAQFFNPSEPSSLKECLLAKDIYSKLGNSDYNINVLKFGETFSSIIESIMEEKN